MIKVTIQVQKQVVANLLSSTIEAGRTYGCGYWAYAEKELSVRPPKLDVSECGETFGEMEETWYVHWPLFKGGVLGFVEHDDESRKPSPVQHKLDLETIQKGLNTMAEKYPHRFAEVMADQVDGALGDEFLQCCFFGELKYG